MMDPFLKGVEKRSDQLILDESTHKQSEARGGASSDVMSTILCGSIAGAIAKTAVAPAERVKMGFQISSEKFSLTKALKNGIEIFQKGGLFSLWRGHSTTIIRVAPYSGISYAAHDYAEHHFKRHLQTEKLPFLFKFLAGSVGGATGTFFTYPLDVLRVRLALTPGASWVSALKSGGMFQGLTPTMLGIIPYAGTAWMVKQTLLENFPIVFHRKPSLIESLALNAAAGISGQFVTYPLDIVRRRMQMASKGTDGKMSNLRSTLRTLIYTEGARGLAKGFSLNIIKGPITLSISFTTYDFLISHYSLKQDH